MPGNARWLRELLEVLPAPARRDNDVPGHDVTAGLQAYLEFALDTARGSRAISALRDAGILDQKGLTQLDRQEVVDRLQEARISLPTRVSTTLARIAVVLGRTAVQEKGLAGATTSTLRDRLRGIRGLGPGGADALLLFGFGRAVFPVDRGSYRILLRHAWIDEGTEYDEASDHVTGAAGGDAHVLRDLSTGLQGIAGHYCKPAKPRCEACPLRPLLPPCGPIGAADM